MNFLLLDLIGAIGFQINDTLTTYYGIKVGASEANFIFRFLNQGRIIDFTLVGVIKVLVAVYLYAWALLVPDYKPLLLLDFYFEAGVTLWNTFTIYRHKKGWKW